MGLTSAVPLSGQPLAESSVAYAARLPGQCWAESQRQAPRCSGETVMASRGSPGWPEQSRRSENPLDELDAALSTVEQLAEFAHAAVIAGLKEPHDAQRSFPSVLERAGIEPPAGLRLADVEWPADQALPITRSPVGGGAPRPCWSPGIYRRVRHHPWSAGLPGMRLVVLSNRGQVSAARNAARTR